MKTLEDHTILYDDECPLCNLYTSGFVKSGMLDEKGREAYSIANPEYFQYVDRVRACNEIALIDKKSNTVYYGLESLLKIIGNSLPIFKPLFASRIFQEVVRLLYAFISYNRKVIIPGRSDNTMNSCVPSFNLHYRLAYLFFTWVITSFILAKYSALLFPYVPQGSFLRESAICGGQIIFQAIALMFISKENAWTYLGNMMTISFAGSMLLLVGMMFSSLITTPLFFLLWFCVVVLLMFGEHLRRMKLLSIPAIASATWVLYRFLVLLTIDIF